MKPLPSGIRIRLLDWAELLVLQLVPRGKARSQALRWIDKQHRTI